MLHYIKMSLVVLIPWVVLIMLLITFVMSMVGCTYSVTLAHTQGTTTDLIDETQSAQPDIRPNIKIPAL